MYTFIFVSPILLFSFTILTLHINQYQGGSTMELKSIKSEKDVKTLLFEEMEKSKITKSIIMLSRNRFKEFIERNDVKKDLYVCGRFSSIDDIKYYIYENEHIVTCKCYGLITFTIVAGVVMVEDFDYFGYPNGMEETKEIHFIE